MGSFFKIQDISRKKTETVEPNVVGWHIANRTYGTGKNLVYIHLFLLTVFGPVYYGPPLQHMFLLRGAIVNRTYGIHKNLYIQQFLLTIIWSY